MTEFTITGIKEARAYLAKLQSGAEAVGRLSVRVGYSRVYAYGIETGRRRSGRLARRAGGAFMLTTAFRQVQTEIKPALVKAVEQGARAVLPAALKLASKVEAIAKPLTPVGKVRGGTLRRDLHTQVATR